MGAAREPEIVDLQEFLRAMGATGGGGGDAGHLHPGRTCPSTPRNYRNGGPNCRCDLSVRSGAAGGEIVTTGVDPDHLTAVLCALEEAGCRVETGPGEIR